MSEKRFVARKVPHQLGGGWAIFDTLEDAETWLENEIDDEPEVIEYERVEQDSPIVPDILYKVIEGEGKTAGHIRMMEYRGQVPRTSAKAIDDD